MKNLLLPLLFFSMSFFVSAQEIEYPLSNNPQIKQALKSIHPAALQNRNQLTISLPFIDDFSSYSIYPDQNKWIDSNAFINSNYPKNPVTAGVATLDGIDLYGNPYDSLSGTTRICDYLTSRPIDLSGLTLSDSVYLSFFYQPQGYGDAPESGDSLVLQFYDNTGNWISIWNADGRTDTVFQRVNFLVSSISFLHAGFQFRFLNYATPNGNRDHWHIDYVKLDKNRSLNDNLIDVGFINRPGSLLINYNSMPWSHYKSFSNPASLFKTAITDSVRNIGYSNTTLNYFSTIKDGIGNILFTSPSNPQNSFTNTVTTFTSNLSSGFVLPTNTNTEADFTIQNFCTPTGPTYPDNDTTIYIQRFRNYYAYDDGSAESAYGISTAFAKMAYRFDLLVQDTLRGLQIYFNPTGLNVHNKLIQLCLWNSISVGSNNEDLVYKQIDLKPYNIDSINGFATYLFDTVLVVNGTVYVGIQQSDADLLGIGVDKNSNASGKMFFNATNVWTSSAVQGAWMMRPLLGDSINLNPGIGIEELHADLVQVYPNPATDYLLINNTSAAYLSLSAVVYNAFGQPVKVLDKVQDKIEIKELAPGVYFIVFRLKQNGTMLLVSRFVKAG